MRVPIGRTTALSLWYGHPKVELRWLPLVGFAHGILIDLLVLLRALVLIPMNFRVLQASSNPL